MKKDIIFLVADKDMEFCLKGLLPRLATVWNIREFTYEIYIHPLHDSGCRTQSAEFLRPFMQDFEFCLVMFDYEGSGGENLSIQNLKENVSSSLAQNGWEDRNVVIIIQPELENWIWVKSPYFAKIINWENMDSLEDWLIEQGHKKVAQIKPNRPKEAFEKALRKSNKKRSSSIFEDIASKVSFKECIDESFNELKNFIIQKFMLDK